MKHIWITLVFLTGLLFAGCASTTRIQPAERAAIKAVQINPLVPLPSEVFFLSQGQALAGGLGGAVGGAIGAASESDNQKAFREILARSGLDLGKELTAAFADGLKKNGVEIREEAADGRFELAVGLMGLGVPNGFYSGLRPLIVVTAVLRDSSGKVLFQDSSSCMNLSSKTDRHTLEEYRNRPELLALEYRKAINAVVDDLVRSYGR
jgi:hypothetical protein